ncbi:hypothetical protein H4S01_000797 [Coemansia sp. RSA 2610]|nr:hypothetical protein H4S01_000797 [Coemansia sp. RSA 2610]
MWCSATPAPCSIVLPFGTIVLTQVPAFIPTQLCARPTASATPLPPFTQSMATMSICDASGTVFLPEDCLPSPTSASSASDASSSSSAESADNASRAVRLHVMPTPTNVLGKRGDELGIFDDFLDGSSDIGPLSGSMVSNYSHDDELSMSGSENSILESESFSVDSWASSDDDVLALGGIDNDIDNLFNGVFGSDKTKSLSSDAKPLESTSDAWPTAAKGEGSSGAVESSSDIASSAVAQSPDSDIVSFSASTSAILGQQDQSSTSHSAGSATLSAAATDSSASLSIASSFPGSSASFTSENSTESSTAHEGTGSSLPLSTAASHETAESSSVVSSKTRAWEAATTGQPLSVAEVSQAPEIATAEAKKPEGLGSGECTAGMFRCTGDSRGFDTCVHGRWGTIRTCSAGTTCVAVEGNSIACA